MQSLDLQFFIWFHQNVHAQQRTFHHNGMFEALMPSWQRVMACNRTNEQKPAAFHRCGSQFSKLHKQSTCGFPCGNRFKRTERKAWPAQVLHWRREGVVVGQNPHNKKGHPPHPPTLEEKWQVHSNHSSQTHDLFEAPNKELSKTTYTYLVPSKRARTAEHFSPQWDVRSPHAISPLFLFMRARTSSTMSLALEESSTAFPRIKFETSPREGGSAQLL